MAKTIQLVVVSGQENVNAAHTVEQGSGAKGKPTRVKAVKGATYQLKDPAAKDVGPDYIRSKRVGKNLHVAFDGSDEADLIIEGYYDEGYRADGSTGLYGSTDSGRVYEYIPEDPTPAGLSANLADGATPVSQVLGGMPIEGGFELAGVPLLAAAAGINPLVVAAGVVGAAALGGGGGGGDGGTGGAVPSGQTGGLASGSDSGSSNNDGITNNKKPSFSGKAEAGSTVTITINGKTYSGVADANGNYSIDITDDLPDGTYVPKITVTNRNGSSTVDGTPFTIDTQVNPATGALTHDAANDTGSSTADSITTNTKPTFSGTGEPGATVKVVVDGQTLITTVRADGTWVTSPSSYTGNGLTGGRHPVEITFTDVAGNTKTVVPDPVYISTGIGNITLSVNAVTLDNTISNSEKNAGGNTAITGRATGEYKEGDVVTLDINGKSFTGRVAADGSYSISVPTADLAADPDKTIAARIAVTDLAGNPGVVNTTHTYLVDIDGPNETTTTLTINAVTPDNVIVGSENTTDATTNITGRAYGEFQEGNTVTLYIKDQTYTGRVDAQGAYSISVPIAILAGDTDTKIEATLAATDRVGNTGSIRANHTYVVDLVGPNNNTTALVIDPVTADNIVTTNDDANINITGRATGEFKVDDEVSFTLNGTLYKGNVDANGYFSIAVRKTDLVANTGKVINATLAAHDVYGNLGSGVTGTQTYAVDTTPPSESTTSIILDPVTDDNIINASEAGATTTAVKGRVTGEFRVGDKVTLKLNVNGTLKSYPEVAVEADGTFVVNVSTAELIAANPKTISSQVVAHDAAGNAGTVTGNTQTYVVDTTPPDASTTTLIVDSVTADNVINLSESGATYTTVKGRVVGQFTAGDVVTLKINGTNYTATVAADGTYTNTQVKTADLTADPDKTIEASIAARDAAGNVGTVTANKPYVVDTNPPAPGSAAINVDPVTDDNLINAAESGQSTTTINGKVSGEFKVGDTVTLKIHNTTYTTTVVDAAGNYSKVVSTSDLLADPDKTIEASVAATDVAGNVGTVSTTQVYTVDTSGPNGTAITLDPITADNVINISESGQTNTTLTGKVTGDYTTGDIVTLTVNGQSYTVAVLADGTFSRDVPTSDLTAANPKTVGASVVAHKPGSNNAGTFTDTANYSVDLTPPNTTTTTLTVDVVTADNIINNAENTGTINITGQASGTFRAGDVVTLTVNNNSYTGTVGADGKYNIAVNASDLAADSDKKIDASIAATDPAGNVGSIGATRTYAVDDTGPNNSTTSIVLDPVTADNIINATEGNNTNTTITGKVTGEFTAGDVITLTVNGTYYTGQVNAQGVFSISVRTDDLTADANKTIEASLVATDAAGNTGTVTADQLYTVDTTVPTNTTLRIDAVTADDIINATEAGAANIAITGKATGEFTVGDTVTLTVNGKTFTGRVDANGNYSIDVPTADLRADTDKTIDGTLAAHDAAGNSATFGAARPYVVDVAGPDSTTTALSVNVVSLDDTINTADAAVPNTTITGTASGTFRAGDVVTLTINGKTFTVSVDAQGVYSIAVPTADLVADGDKTIDASIAAHDLAGNVGTISTTHHYLVDTVGPNDGTTSIIVNPIATDDIINNAEAGIATTTVTGKVSGEFRVGDAVTITVNGNSSVGTVLDADGNYSIGVATADLVAETGRTFTATVAARDAAGNTGNVSTVHRYVVDTNVPNGGAALGLTIDADANNDGTINYVELNGANTLTVTATFDPTKATVGDIVTFTPVGGTAVSVTLTQAMVTAGRVSTNFATPADGATLDVTAVMRDSAGNATTPAQDTAVINRTNPNTTATIDITAITTDAGVEGDFITNDTSLVYSGTLSGFSNNGDKVKVELLNAQGQVVDTQIVTPTSATEWTYSPPTTQTAGDYTLRATIVDAQGVRVNNTAPVNGTGGGQDTQAITIDTTAPSLVSITMADNSLTAGETSVVTFTFSKAPLDFTLDDIDLSGAQGYVDTLVQSTTDPKVWTAVFHPSANVDDTTNLIKVANSTYTDVAGNNGTGNQSANFEIHTLQPSVAITLDKTALKAGDTSTVTFTFSEVPTGFDAADVSVAGAQGALTNLQATSDPKVWTATFTPTADVEDTTNLITVADASYTNAAGNAGAAGSSANFTIDTKAPTLAISMSDNNLVVGDTSTVTFTFSEAPAGFTASDIAVTPGMGAISNLTQTSATTWTATFTPAANQAATGNTISVAANVYTDVAGNNGAAASASFDINTKQPTVTVELSDSALIAGETSTVTFTFSEVPSNFTGGALANCVDLTGVPGALSGFTQVSATQWTATFTPTVGVEDATNLITVRAGSYTNSAGNAGAAGSSANFTIDTLAPTTTIVIDAIDDNVGSTQGKVDTSGITDDTTPTVKGTLSTALAAGETVHIFDNGVDIGVATLVNGSTTQWTFTDTRSTIANNTVLHYTAKVMDAAGNSGATSNQYNATIRTSVPTITITSIAGETIDANALNGVLDANDYVALNNAPAGLPVISGTTANVEAGQQVAVTINGHTYNTTVQNVVNGNGTWSVSINQTDALALNNGNAYGITATVSDAAGQTATDTDNKLVVSFGKLDTPTIIDVRTNQHSPILTGVAQKLDPSNTSATLPLETGDTLQIEVQNTPGNSTVTSLTVTIGGTYPTGFSYDTNTKTWSYDLAAAGVTLPDGTYNVSLIAVNTHVTPTVIKADMSSHEIIIDSKAPVFDVTVTDPTVAENIAANSVVYTAVADEVSNGNHGITYSLKPNVGDVTKFTINPVTGEVSIVESPNYEAKSSYTFTIVATDSFGNASEKQVTVNVTNVNEAPVAVADTATAIEAGGAGNATAGTNPTGNVLTNDTDPDAGDTKTVKDIKAASQSTATTVAATGDTTVQGSYGTLVIKADGSYTYTVDQTNATVQALNPNSAALSDVFTYTVKDAAGLTSSANITVKVNGANDAPVVANAIADTTATEGDTTFSYVVPDNAFSDVDTDDTLTYTYTVVDANGTALGTQPTWLSFNASTRTFSGTPPTGAGTVHVKVTAADTGGLSASDTFDIVVGAANHAPVANPTTVNSPLSTITKPTVTITDNQSAGYVANGTAVTFTLKFSEPIDETTFTTADLALSGQDTTVASVLTKVNSTTWTYTAKAAATGTTPLMLSMGNAYNSALGQSGVGGVDVQLVGTAVTPLPPTIKVSTATGNVPDADSGYIETLKDGGWVVTYSNSSTRSYFQRYNAQGSPVGVEVALTLFAQRPTVGALANGGFVIAGTTSGNSVIQLYDSSSNPIGTRFTLTGVSEPSVAGLNDGSFVLTGKTSAGQNAVYHYDSTGNQIGQVVNLGTNVTSDGTWVTKLNGGGFVTAWSQGRTATAGAPEDVYFQIFNESGTPVGSPSKAYSTSPTASQFDASVAELSDGGFVVTWLSVVTTNSDVRVLSQRFDAQGNPVGSQQPLVTGSVFLGSPTVEGLVGGGYVVVAHYVGTTGYKFVLQNYDANGLPVGSATVVQTPNSSGSYPNVTALPNGGYVLAFRGATEMDQMIFGPVGSVTNPAYTTSADTLGGSDFADTITGGGGADKIYAGGGDDTIILNTDNVTQLGVANNGMVVDGGTGVNLLRVTNTTAGTGTTLDLTNATVASKVHGISVIDITGPTTTATNNTLKLSWSAVSALSGATDNAATTDVNESKMLVVNGNAGDAVQMVNLSSWTKSSVLLGSDLATKFGSAYNFTGAKYYQYTLNGVTVFVDANVDANVTNLASPTTPPVSQAVTIGSLFASTFSDVDGASVAAGQFKGVAITNAGATADLTSKGKYQIFVNGTWTDLAAGLTDSTAIYADPATLIRFVGVAGTEFIGAQQDLTVRLVDTSGQSNSASLTVGSTVNVSTNGGSTAYSGNTVTLHKTTTPVVLDLNHDGALSYSQVQMDVTGDGVLDQTAWAAPQDGVLVWNKYADGKVHNSSQYAFSQYGAAGATDLQGLAAGFDSNHDGVLNAADSKFAEFAVWQDANGNGVADAGEMRSLTQAGITSINLSSDGVTRVPTPSVVEAGHSTALLTDGTTMVVADAAFATQALPYTVNNSKLVLAGAGLDLNVSSFMAQHGALAEVDVSGTGANSIKLNLADVLQGTPNGQLMLTGGADDSAQVNLPDWTDTGTTVTQAGHTYEVYTAANGTAAQLLIDQAMLNAHHVS
jgi:VCBS repeat-containing protein